MNRDICLVPEATGIIRAHMDTHNLEACYAKRVDVHTEGLLSFNALTIGCTMSKHAKPLSFSLPLVRVMVRKRAVQSKWGTHAGKVGRVFNAGKYMIAAFPKRSARCITANLRVS